jgi:integrase
MATIKYLLQSKKDNANIYIRFSINRKSVWKRKTGFIINSSDWSLIKGQPMQKSEDLKQLKFKLDKLSVLINESFNVATSKGVVVCGDWLQRQIDLYNNKVAVVDLDILTNSVDEYISTSDNLKQGSIKNLENLKKFIVDYENEYLKGKKVVIREIDLKFIEVFTKNNIAKGRSINYIGTYISILRAVVNKASLNGVLIHPQFKGIKAIRANKEPDEIIVLTEIEQQLIAKADIKLEALINARKWLLLGCLIGQRAGDLLKITEHNIKTVDSMTIIELKQKKTGKLVAIPLIPAAKNILENGLPYTINLENFNSYSKRICEIAKINTLVKGKMRINGKRTLTSGKYEKWKVISSHVCRRSFATNYYGKIPTPVLMQITAHTTEEIFRKYIGKTTYDNAYQMLEYFSKLTTTSDS